MAAHRYWRINVTASYFARALITEIQFRASIGGADETTGKPVTASSQFNGFQSGSKAFDDSTATNWQSATGQALPQWVRVDLGAGNEKDIVEYTIQMADNGTGGADQTGPYSWELQWSDDDAAWTTVDTQTEVPVWSDLETRVYTVAGSALITEIPSGSISVSIAGRPLSSVGGVASWNIAAGSIGLTAQTPQSILAIPAGSIGLTAQAPQSLITLKPPRAGFTPVYRLTITDPLSGLPDLVIQRIANFQARTRSGVNSYLTVTIPGVDLIDSINALIAGEFYIEGWLRYADGTTTAVQEIARANIDRADPYEGANNQSIVLTGYKQTTYTLPKIVQVNQAITKVAQNGVNRWRIPPALTLRPLDTLDYQGEQIVAQQIVYTVGPRQGYMDVSDSTGF